MKFTKYVKYEDLQYKHSWAMFVTRESRGIGVRYEYVL